jgi:hypothetical protein
MCKIKGCYGKKVARGLCAKHYMRWMRTGSTETRKPGPRPKRSLRNDIREAMREEKWSARTMARFLKAFELLSVCGQDVSKNAILAASRRSGSLNVSKLLDLAEQAYFQHSFHDNKPKD